MTGGDRAGFDRLAARLIARARWLARAHRVTRALAPGDAWRRADLLWPSAVLPNGD